MEKKTSELIKEMKGDIAYYIKQYLDEHSDVYVMVYGRGNEKTYNLEINYVYMWIDSYARRFNSCGCSWGGNYST